MYSSSKPTVGLLFDIAALNKQNEIASKQAQKRRKEVKAEEVRQEQLDKANTAVKKKQANQKDLYSIRKARQEAMINRLSKMNAKRSSDALEASQKEEANDAKATELREAEFEGMEMPEFMKEMGLEDVFSYINVKEDNLFTEADLKNMTTSLMGDISGLKERMEAEGIKEFEFDAESPNELLEKMFNPENLIDCKATPEELEAAKADAKFLGRMLRQNMKAIFPQIGKAVAFAVTEHGLDLTNPEHNPYAKDENGELINKDPTPLFAGPLLDSKYFKDASNPDAKVSIDMSIFASVFKALEINQLLQELGIESEIVAGKVQNEISRDLILEAEEKFRKNTESIVKSEGKNCMEKAMGNIGIAVGSILTAMGMPWFGVPIILASTGTLKKIIQDLAKAMGVPEYVIQSIIMAITAIAAAPMLLAPGGWTAYMGTLLFVAGLTGWIENTVGLAATRQLDPEKFPTWVTWAAMGIEIGLSLVAMGSSILNAMRAAGRGIVNGVRAMANGASRAFAQGYARSSASIASAASTGARVSAQIASVARGLASVARAAGSALWNGAKAIASRIINIVKDIVNKVRSFSRDMRSAVSGKNFTVASGGANGGPFGGAVGGAQGTQSVAGLAQQGGTAAARNPVAMAQTGSPIQGTNGSATQRQALTQAATSQANASSQIQGVQVAPIPGTTAPTATQTVTAINSKTGVLTQLQEMVTKLSNVVERLTKQLLEMLIKLHDKIAGQQVAAQLAGALRGGADTAKRAQRLYNCITRLMKLSRKIAKWMLLIAQGMEAGVQFEMARLNTEIGEILKEAAELSGETSILDQFVKSLNLSVKSIQSSKTQHAQDSGDQIERLGSILTAQRRSSNMLMSA